MNNNYAFENLTVDTLRSIMTRIYKGSSQAEVNEATQYLKAYAKTIESLPVFVQILTQDQILELRQLAAIILKRSITTHLLTMSSEDRNILRNTILSRFYEEKSNKVQKSLAVLISVVLKVSCEQSEHWSDPIVIISEKTNPSQPEEVRLQGFLLLTIILEFAGEHLTNYYEDLFKFFFQTIKDNSPQVRRQTLICVLNMYTSVAQENLIKAFGEIYPLLLECFYESMRENDEDTIEKVLEMFHTLTEDKNVLFDNNKLIKLIDLFCTQDAILSKELNSLFRESMVDIIFNIMVSYKTVISKNEAMLKKIMEVMFTLSCTKDEDSPKDRDTIQEVALFFIREAAILLPKKRSYPIYKEYLVKMFESDNVQVLEGAFLILGNLAEGCCEYLRRELPFLMKNYIQKGLESSNDVILKATFYAINFFANYLVPEIIVYHPMVVPPMIKKLDITDQKMLQGNVLCLEIFSQELTPETVMTYVPDMIPKLIEIVDNPANIIPVKRHSILTIAACAEAAEEKFAPYAEKLLPLLSHLITNLNDLQYVEIKATAVKCVGLILGHCLKETPQIYEKYIYPLIPVVSENLQHTDNSILKEFCFQFFYNLASYLGENFKVYLTDLVSLIFEAIKNAHKLEVQKPQVVSLDSDSEEEDGENQWVDDNAISELSAAIRCLGRMADACPAEYAPYYEETVNYLQNSATHFHFNVRIQTMLCWEDLAIALTKFGNNGQLPKFNKGLPCNQRLPVDAENFVGVEVFERILHAIEEDNNVHVLNTALEVVQELTLKLGPAAIDTKLDRITDAIVLVLRNETTSQNQAFEGEEDVHGEVFGSVTLLIDALIKVCGEGFLPYFRKLYPEFVRFTTEDTLEDDVAEVMGCFGQATKYMPSAAKEFGVNMLDICFKVLEYGDEYVNRNMAFAVGFIVENGGETIYPYYKTIMQKMNIIYETATLVDTKDNALAAIGRMVYTNPSLVPLNIVLPAIIKEMPLTGDPKEERTLVKMLIFLFETNIEALQGNEEKCIELLIDGVAERKKYKIKDENVIKAIGQILKKLSENEGAKRIIQNYATKLSQENVDILNQLLTTQY